jgi:hypothetical protein
MMSDRLWVVVERIGGEVTGAEVFSDENDARHYYEERIKSPDVSPSDEIFLVPSVLHSRQPIAEDETLWGVEIPDVNAEFVEGLLEEIEYEPAEAAQEALTARFLREKRDKLKQEASERVREYVLDELRDYVEHGLEGCSCPEE